MKCLQMQLSRNETQKKNNNNKHNTNNESKK